MVGWDPTLDVEVSISEEYGRNWFTGGPRSLSYDQTSRVAKPFEGKGGLSISLDAAGAPAFAKYEGGDFYFATPPLRGAKRDLATCSGVKLQSDGVSLTVRDKTWPIIDVRVHPASRYGDGDGWVVLAYQKPTSYPRVRGDDYRVYRLQRFKDVDKNELWRLREESEGSYDVVSRCDLSDPNNAIDQSAFAALVAGNLGVRQPRVLTIVNKGAAEDIQLIPASPIRVDPSGETFLLRNESAFDVNFSGAMRPASGLLYSPKNGRTDEVEISALAGGNMKLVPYPGKEHFIDFITVAP